MLLSCSILHPSLLYYLTRGLRLNITWPMPSQMVIVSAGVSSHEFTFISSLLTITVLVHPSIIHPSSFIDHRPTSQPTNIGPIEHRPGKVPTNYSHRARQYYQFVRHRSGFVLFRAQVNSVRSLFGHWPSIGSRVGWILLKWREIESLFFVSDLFGSFLLVGTSILFVPF